MLNKVKDSTILVTGGAGFIGSYVIEELIPLQPKKIIIIDNFIRGSRENMKSFINNPVIELHEADIRDTERLEQCICRLRLYFSYGRITYQCLCSQSEGRI